MMRMEKSKKKRKSVTNSSPSSIQQTQAKRRKAAEARAAAANSRRLAAQPGGRQLNDDTYQSPASPARSHRGVRGSNCKSAFHDMKSNDDVSTTLLSSIQNKKSGNVANFLRAAMKNALGKTYEVSRAVVRNSAVASKNVSFTRHPSSLAMDENDTDQRDKKLSLGIYMVKYPKGVEGRGFYEDEVEIIGMDALKAVILAVYANRGQEEGNDEALDDGTNEGGREMLRPRNMALVSPRVFWSLWFYYREKCTSIEESLKLLHPELDWKFLQTRSRELSEKAKDNLRQKRELVTPISADQREKEYNEGKRVVEAVEEAMEKMYEDNAQNAREQAARAALSRLTTTKSSSRDSNYPTWSLETPEEIDKDELLECVTGPLESFEVSVNTPTVDHWVDGMISKCLVRNWRELANADPDTLYPILSNIKVGNGSNACKEKSTPSLSKEMIDKWIEAAQVRTIEEIMLQILDGNEDLYLLLRDEARAGTPKDLCLWSSIPSELSTLARSKKFQVTEKDVSRWCERARIALEKLEWLGWYITPVS